jgi:hypothetical protein
MCATQSKGNNLPAEGALDAAFETIKAIINSLLPGNVLLYCYKQNGSIKIIFETYHKNESIGRA